MAQMNENVSSLALKKIWDGEEIGYFLNKDSDSLSSLGFKKYWEAVDRTVRYCDTTTMVKLQMKILQPHKEKFPQDKSEASTFENHKLARPKSVHTTKTLQHYGQAPWRRDRFHWRRPRNPSSRHYLFN